MDVNDGSLYQKDIQNQYSRHNTMSIQEISNETSMDDINQEVNQLTDVEEEEEQDGEIINASVFRDTISTSNVSHNPELQKTNFICLLALSTARCFGVHCFLVCT